MSGLDAEEIMDSFEKWDSRSKKRDFIARMERKLYRKEHHAR